MNILKILMMIIFEVILIFKVVNNKFMYVLYLYFREVYL